LTTKQLPDNGRTMSFAELHVAQSGRPTVLFYMHLDGQAVNASKWQQESPWKPTLKQRNGSGQWEAIPMDRLFGKSADPEWRMFAKSSSDDKAPVMMILAALDALKVSGYAPVYNVKVLLDSEEEKSSPSLPSVIS
jgi:acetylornithine deacetylase/succinyl-diaminopimelate desuccinylase-like protein